MTTPKKTVVLYEDHDRGSVKAHVVGAFMRGSRHFLVIHPGYDSQGRRRNTWTQVVHDGVPIWEFKRQATRTEVSRHFCKLWDDAFGARNIPLIEQSLNAAKAARRRAWRDGESGVEPAKSVTVDGRGEGVVYTA